MKCLFLLNAYKIETLKIILYSKLKNRSPYFVVLDH